MRKLFGWDHLKDISISKKLYFIVGAMAILIIIELVTLWFSITTLSSVRAFVGGEGLWSKAQKDAVYNLGKYSRSHKEEDYLAYQKFMAVPMGDHKTRLELLKPNPDLKVAREGFLEGRINPDDIDGAIKLFRRFYFIYYIHKAIVIWSEADSIIAQLTPISQQLHAEINSPVPSNEKIDKIVEKIDPINQKLTVLEDDFSYTLGAGSRWLENLVLKILLLVALTVEITGLVLSISVSRGIRRGLNAITKTTSKIMKGDLSARATVFSKDEIGNAAIAVNQMTEQLIQSNKELEQFAYISSHDLQEPLRTITNYVGLFKEKYDGKLDKDSEKYLEFITLATQRMQILIKEVLNYSRIGHDKIKVNIDCNKVLRDVLNDMSITIKENNAAIYADKLPVIFGYSDIKSLFQNLISNAVKYKKNDIPPTINITVKDNPDEWLFAFKDNGIGIDKEHHERIFAIFQKLHSPKQYAGTGIGLANCKKIVEIHSGKIWIESELGKGSTFYFTIPKNNNNVNHGKT
jgi:signal transduction histidine kinase